MNYFVSTGKYNQVEACRLMHETNNWKNKKQQIRLKWQVIMYHRKQLTQKSWWSLQYIRCSYYGKKSKWLMLSTCVKAKLQHLSELCALEVTVRGQLQACVQHLMTSHPLLKMKHLPGFCLKDDFQKLQAGIQCHFCNLFVALSVLR